MATSPQAAHDLTYPAVEHGVARGLPREAYTSLDGLQLEFQRVFAKAWTFIGFAHEIPAPGDVFPALAAGQPIMVVRTTDSEIKAFHNVCRHRGHSLVQAPRRGLKNFVCPYHSWTYALDGRLQRTPHFGGHGQSVEGFPAERFGLQPVRCDVWHDWIFVDLGAGAPPLGEYLSPLGARVAEIDFDRLKVIAKLDLGVVQANWKLLIENFIEPYHVPVVHRESAGGQPLSDHYMIVDGHCVGCAIDVTAPSDTDPGERLDMSTRYLMLFPNFVFAWYLPDQLGVHLNVPESPERTRQWRVIYHLGDDEPDPEYVDRLSTLWTRVHREDRAIVEQLQIGRTSPVMDDGGLLSPHWETSVRRFHELLVDALM